MSTRRIMPGGWVAREDLPLGPDGRALCRWCNLEVPAGRRSFCSEFCVNEWKLRSDPGYLRDRVFERDQGVCALCGFNCAAEWNRLRRLPRDRRQHALSKWNLRPGMRRSLWDADHIVPVIEGGGECDLENIRTLCLRCHRNVTGQLRVRVKERKNAHHDHSQSEPPGSPPQGG